MNRIAVNEISTYRWSFEEDVIAYANRRVDGIGVWRPKLEEYGVEKGIELLAENLLRVSSLGWTGGFTGSDGRGFSESVHDALNAIDLAHQLGAESLIVVAGDRNGHTSRHARRLLIQALSELSEAAAALHIDLAIEPMHEGSGSQGCFLNNIHNTLDIIGEVAWPGLGIVLDTYHLGHGDGILDWISDVTPLIRLVQLGDATHVPFGEQDRCLLGEGKLLLQQIVERLEDNGYDGYLELELIGESVEHLQYEHVLDHSIPFMNDLVRDAARA